MKNKIKNLTENISLKPSKKVFFKATRLFPAGLTLCIRIPEKKIDIARSASSLLPVDGTSLSFDPKLFYFYKEIDVMFLEAGLSEHEARVPNFSISNVQPKANLIFQNIEFFDARILAEILVFVKLTSAGSAQEEKYLSLLALLEAKLYFETLPRLDNYFSNGKLNAGYYFKNSFRIGRLYADQGYQLFPRNLRWTLSAPLYFDFDLVNAQPSLALDLACALGHEVSALTFYVENRDFLVSYLESGVNGEILDGISGKIELLSVFNGKAPTKQLFRAYYPWALRLLEEVTSLNNKVASPGFCWPFYYKGTPWQGDLYAMLAERNKAGMKQKDFTPFSLALQTLETIVLLHARDYIVSIVEAQPLFEEWAPSFVPVFDGFLLDRVCSEIVFGEGTPLNHLNSYIRCQGFLHAAFIRKPAEPYSLFYENFPAFILSLNFIENQLQTPPAVENQITKLRRLEASNFVSQEGRFDYILSILNNIHLALLISNLEVNIFGGKTDFLSALVKEATFTFFLDRLLSPYKKIINDFLTNPSGLCGTDSMRGFELKTFCDKKKVLFDNKFSEDYVDSYFGQEEDQNSEDDSFGNV